MTTLPSDIRERLEEAVARWQSPFGDPGDIEVQPDDLIAALAELDRLSAALAVAGEALEPFAAYVATIQREGTPYADDDFPVAGFLSRATGDEVELTLGDFRFARAALARIAALKEPRQP